tara:strand:- start:1722 stop:2780 length:1059 start_codon:yes stop_codon:yes gene_type:complete
LKGTNNKTLSPIPHSGGFSSFLLGLLAVLFSFVTLQEAAPKLKSSFRSLNMNPSTDPEIQWEINPIPDSQSKPKFVEANPNIPENPPDKVNQFSFRNQQAAQPEENDKVKLAKTPKLKYSNNSQKVLEKNKEIKRVKPSNPPVTIPKNKSELFSKIPEKSNPPKAKLLPKSEAEGIQIKESQNKVKPKDKNHIASLQMQNSSPLSHPSLNPSRIRQKTRPKLSTDLIHGPIMKSVTSAPRLGQIAIECRLHPYGAYIQEMLQSIEEQWNQLAKGSMQFLQHDRLPGRITLRFKLLANGQISNLSRMDNEGYSLAAELCRQAIASRVPFGEWTEKMVNDFGQSDEITISFKYL